MRKKVPVLTNPSQVNFFVNKLNNEASLDVIDELTDNQYSRNSLLGILSDWNRYLSFCLKYHINTLPASVTAIRRFLETEAKERKFSSLKRYTATLSLLHTVLGFPNPIKHKQVRFTLVQLQISKSGDAKQTNALTHHHLKQLDNALAKPNAPYKDIRDLAVYNVMFECALKRSELKNLKVSHISMKDGTSCVHLADSTYQLSDVANRHLQRWIEISESFDDQPLFRSIDRHGHIHNQPLDDSSIYRIVRRASDLLGLTGSLSFSGNSIRVGATQELAKQGMTIRDIQDFGRWMSPVMPAQYLGQLTKSEEGKMVFKEIIPWQS
ncbi:tyrosine-type recombinase/integrase [Vibrio pelagius]|uniref:tyrosine-type recombinase/integrase n=1 Tax=Vibrio pelagius TaxID=28169 RepID=UPI003553DB0F